MINLEDMLAFFPALSLGQRKVFFLFFILGILGTFQQMRSFTGQTRPKT